MVNYGEKIRKLRELQNISPKNIASELDMSVSGYNKIERNEVDLTLSKLQKISKVLGVDLSQILNFDPSQVIHVSNNKLVQGLGARADNMHFHGDDYKEKYIQMLEQENERLKKLVGEK
jgi:transcriptional regulator with XRE-family HTH domain